MDKYLKKKKKNVISDTCVRYPT